MVRNKRIDFTLNARVRFITVSFSSRQSHVKTRERPQSDEMSEAWIVEAVVCYDLLHNDLTKPVQAMGLSSSDVDPSFRGRHE